MTIDNVKVNGEPVGGFLSGDHGATNPLDSVGKQHGLTSAYCFTGKRDAAFAVISFVMAYIGSHGNVTPIKTFEFDLMDESNNVSQHHVRLRCNRVVAALAGAAGRWRSGISTRCGIRPH